MNGPSLNLDFDIRSSPYNFIKNVMHFDLLKLVGMEYGLSRGGPIALHFCHLTEQLHSYRLFPLCPDRKLDLIIVSHTLSRLKKMRRDKIRLFDVSLYENNHQCIFSLSLHIIGANRLEYPSLATSASLSIFPFSAGPKDPVFPRAPDWG